MKHGVNTDLEHNGKIYCTAVHTTLPSAIRLLPHPSYIPKALWKTVWISPLLEVSSPYWLCYIVIRYSSQNQCNKINVNVNVNQSLSVLTAIFQVNLG